MSVTEELLNALRLVESNGNPNARSPAGALGAYQFMPATARQFGIDPLDEGQSREAARKYLTQLVGQFGSVDKALQAYNWGPGNMRAYEQTGMGAKGQPMPAETQAYAPKVLEKAKMTPAQQGKDLSGELFSDVQKKGEGRDLSGDIFGKESPGVLKSAAMGFVRGARDMVDGGAQLLTRGLEAVAPAGSDFEKYMTGERQRVEGINRTAEQEYQQGNYGKTGSVARVGGNIVASLPMGGGPLAASTAGRIAQGALVGGGMGALQKVDESAQDYWTQKTKQAGIGAAGGAVGNLGAGYLTDALGNRIAAQAARQQVNAPRDAILQASQQAGYVVPPSQATGGFLNRALEGISGKITTAQNASAKNSDVTNALVRKALGQADDFSATPANLANVRGQAGQAYEAVKQFPQPFVADGAFSNAVNKIESEYTRKVSAFPSLGNPKIEALVSDLKQGSFDPRATVEIMKQLRSDASANLGFGAKPEQLALGRIQKDAAKELEDLVARNLQQSGQQGLYDAFTEARKLIAKTKTVERATDEAGNTSALKLANALRNRAPLSGELKTAAQFADQFPKAAQEVSKMGSLPQWSPLDTMGAVLAGGAGMATGTPSLALMSLLRPATRAAILSGPYQRAMTQPSYGNGLLGLLGAPALTGAGASLGAAGLLSQY